VNNQIGPERTCLICKIKGLKDIFFRLVKNDEKIYFDEKGTEQSRGMYVCKNKECLQRLSKHKKVLVSMEELVKMSVLLKNEKKDYLNILKVMKNSQSLTFGLNMVFDEIEKVHFVVMAEDISEKNSNKIIEKCKERNIPFVFHSTKSQMGDIFNKDEVTVIAITNKKVARGLIN
jgi:hypothetical protein